MSLNIIGSSIIIYICGTNQILPVYTMHAPIFTTHTYSMVMFSIAAVCLSVMLLRYFWKHWPRKFISGIQVHFQKTLHSKGKQTANLRKFQHLTPTISLLVLV